MSGVALAQERARWFPEASAAAIGDTLARGPLVPIAVTFSAGVVADRWFEISLRDSLIASLAALTAWLIAMHGRQRGLALVYLWGAALGFGAAYHHWHVNGLAANDISHFAALEPSPAVVRGVLHSEPVPLRPATSPLRTMPTTKLTRVVLHATELQQLDGWRAVSGLVLVNAEDDFKNVHVGDVVEVTGRLYAPDGPDNPGEFDYALHLRDGRIGAILSPAIVRLEERWPGSPSAWLARIRGWGQQVLQSFLPQTYTVATALLLGDGSAMAGEEWGKYHRTAVLHVLAISGQHLVILAIFFGLWLRALRVPQRQGVLIIAALLIFYGLLVGARPPVVRAAVMVLAFCLATLMRRPAVHANCFALAWLAVVMLDPTDAFDTGCQLSFLAVAVLCWGGAWWTHHNVDPVDMLIEESRSPRARFALGVCRGCCRYYLVTLVVWLAISPLVAAKYHVVSPVALLIGPPMVVFTTIALISGFLVLVLSPVVAPLAWLFGQVTEFALQGADHLVSAAVNCPGAYFYVQDIPDWWLVIFYSGLALGLTVAALRPIGRWLLLSGAGWLGVLLCANALRTAEFRCTFLAVGHGACTVIETAEGQTLVYDAGAMSGPEVTRKQIAPYLWQRGIRRIDELFISHADLDHFNGLPALLERFSVERITCTPSFTDRRIPAVQLTLEAVEKHRTPLRIVKAGEHLKLGSVAFDVLHPPEPGPPGKENARSLVMRMTTAGHSILLTGDLEEPGLKMVLSLPSVTADVMSAPHHGSKASNTHELAKWARPKLVISSQGSWHGKSETPEPYKKIGAAFLGTWPEGAVTLRFEGSDLIAESYKTKKRLVVADGLR